MNSGMRYSECRYCSHLILIAKDRSTGLEYRQTFFRQTHSIYAAATTEMVEKAYNDAVKESKEAVQRCIDSGTLDYFRILNGVAPIRKTIFFYNNEYRVEDHSIPPEWMK